MSIFDIALEHPLDIDLILRKRKAIKKEYLFSDKFVELNIAILGGSTTSEIKNIFEVFLLKSGIKPQFYESEYNKYYEDALFGNEKLQDFKPDIIYVHTNYFNIDHFPSSKSSQTESAELLDEEVKKYRSILESLSRFDCSIIQNNFEFPMVRTLGNLDSYDWRGKTHFVTCLNQELACIAREMHNVYINDINYLSSYMGLSKWFDNSLWYTAKYSMSMEAIPHLAFNVVKIVNAIFGKSKKCLVLDLDNTCWGGVIGDDGIDGIQIGTETAIAEAFSSFQTYAKELSDRGITLAVCSKNEYDNAKKGFSHPDSILKFESFNSFMANWNPKHLNIIEIASEMNIGIESLVFIDDNPVERDLVSSQIPAVAVPNVGSDVVNFITHIDRAGYFEPVTLSADDVNRKNYYEDNKKRVKEQSTYQSYEEFLTSLNMTAEIKIFSTVYLDRIAQLTNKTNQFNLTTKRYTVGEIEKISTDSRYLNLYGKLTDKFGDNGLVAIIVGALKGNQCHLELWLMSCRVIKRDLEYAMLDELVKHCLKNDIWEIVGYYYETEKNGMVSDLYERLGFMLTCRKQKDSVWSLDLKNYKNRNHLIGVNNE